MAIIFVNSEIVLMFIGYSCNIVGIGSIKIIMHDGVVKTLKEVEHVLAMLKILFV